MAVALETGVGWAACGVGESGVAEGVVGVQPEPSNTKVRRPTDRRRVVFI